MDTSERRIELANRLLSYREYGDPDGAPLLYFHGYPSSSLEASYIDAPARERGLRIIAPDRPGMGGSSMAPNRRITQWPKDVGVLTNRLGIDRFAVLAVSSGAPYAYACGNSLSRRVVAIGVISGETPGRSHIKATAKAFWQLAALPAKGRRFQEPERAERAWQKLFRGASEREQAAAHDPGFRRAMLAAIPNAFVEGSGGPAKDYALVTGANWGFAMGNVLVERLFVWHGDADTRVPIAEVRHLTERLPHCDMRVLEAEGHYSAWTNHHEEALDTIAEQFH